MSKKSKKIDIVMNYVDLIDIVMQDQDPIGNTYEPRSTIQ